MPSPLLSMCGFPAPRGVVSHHPPQRVNRWGLTASPVGGRGLWWLGLGVSPVASPAWLAGYGATGEGLGVVLLWSSIRSCVAVCNRKLPLFRDILGNDKIPVKKIYFFQWGLFGRLVGDSGGVEGKAPPQHTTPAPSQPRPACGALWGVSGRFPVRVGISLYRGGKGAYFAFWCVWRASPPRASPLLRWGSAPRQRGVNRI